MFETYIRDFIKYLLPVILRTQALMDWLYSLLAPGADLVEWFSDYRDETSRNLSFNGQTIVLERALNLHYDTGDGIYITNAEITGTVAYMYKQGDDATMYAWEDGGDDTLYLWYSGDVVGAYDFTVYVPVALVFEEVEMRAFVDQYRLAGKRYQIVTY